jgi:hypothetical protein
MQMYDELFTNEEYVNEVELDELEDESGIPIEIEPGDKENIDSSLDDLDPEDFEAAITLQSQEGLVNMEDFAATESYQKFTDIDTP